MKRQSGQSMAEFAAGAAVLSLLLLGTLAIGGYQEVDRRGVLAARQSAWVQEWSQGGADVAALARDLHRDFLADSAVRDPPGRRLLVAEDDVALRAGPSTLGGVAGTTAQVLLAPLRVASGFLGASFDLHEAGLIQGDVRARIAPLTTMPAPFDSLELELQAPFALLGDAWQAADLEHVRRRVAGLVPASRLQGLAVIWRPLAVPLGLLEPSLRNLCFGLIEPDRIPEDRLGPGRSPLPDRCP